MSKINPRLKEALNMKITIPALEGAIERTEGHPEVQMLVRAARAWLENGPGVDYPHLLDAVAIELKEEAEPATAPF